MRSRVQKGPFGWLVIKKAGGTISCCTLKQICTKQQFLNEFDASVREKLAHMNSKLNKIERNLDYCESSFESAAKEGDEIT